MSMYGKLETGIDCSNIPSLTVQSDRKQANINSIIKKIEKGHMIDKLSAGTPFYGDVSKFSGLQESIMQVQEAEEMFMDMSADIRKRFHNDPVQLVRFLEDKNNLNEAIELGICVAPKVAKNEKSEAGETSPPAKPTA